MKKIRMKWVLIFVLLLFFLEVLLYFFVSSNYLFIAGLFIINLLLINRIYYIIKSLELSNSEKIKEASTIAENAISYASNETSIGIIDYDPTTFEVTWLNPFATEVYLKDGQTHVSPELVKNYISLAQKGKDIFKVESNVYRFSVDEKQTIITFVDVTAESNLYQEKMGMQTAIGIISVDNYYDITDKMDEKQISYLNSFLTTILSDWLDDYKIFYKRLNAERYFFVAEYKDIKKMMESKFQILDSIRKESNTRDLLITLSIGISYGGSTLSQTGGTAQTNLDTALVRGGDQVVVKEAKDTAKPTFYGGKTVSAAKRTRVRSRAMSTAIKGILAESTDVYIMGHRFPDMDAIGSAFGMARLVQFNNKTAWIVIDSTESIPDVKRVMTEVEKYPELAKQIISPKDAIRKRTEGSLLVMVDYHRPSLSISLELYEQFEKIIIIDHHRRGDEFPEKPLLTYIESSASSASELVTELIEYQSNSQHKLEKFEASLLLSGIVVDTKSFSVRTTARTFDVASYLRTCGADSSLVQYLLSSDLVSYLEMNNLIAKSEYVTPDTVIVSGNEEKEYDSVTAAKTADTLLSMIGINAVFVITKRSDKKIGISARSSGSINVQLIMENLGGGGHFTNAAAQLSNITIAEAKERLLKVIHQNIDAMYKEE